MLFELISDKQLLQLCFIVCILGFAFLIFFAFNLQPIQVSIGELNDSFIGEKVSLKGQIIEYNFSKNAINFKLFDLKELKSVLFNPTFLDFELIESKPFVKVIGRISKQQNNLQLIVEKIEILTRNENVN